MELNEEQKARAKQLADAVGRDPGKYFSGALWKVVRKGTNEIGTFLTDVKIKLKLDEKYAQVDKLIEKIKAEIEVLREAYQVWYKENGSDLVFEEKIRLKLLFEIQADKFDQMLAQLKENAEDIIEKFKNKL